MAGGDGFRCVGVVAEEKAIGGAVVVEAFGRWVEGEVDVLAIVAIERWVVEVVRQLGGLEGIRVEFAGGGLRESESECFRGVA